MQDPYATYTSLLLGDINTEVHMFKKNFHSEII